jgi:hemerythrin-like domain-containing protein
MIPIGPLMWEHRLIERMVKLMKEKLVAIEETGKLDSNFISVATDFLRTYADRCHHGKEEDILFRELALKTLLEEDKKTMDELIEEHKYARKTVTNLVQITDKYAPGNIESIDEALSLLRDLSEFYPRHIEKEDRHFFYPSMKYFTPEEQQSMLQEFWEFDRKMIHEKYAKVIEGLIH